MAVVAVKAAPISDADSNKLVNARVFRGELRGAVGKVEMVNGDSIASVYRCVRVPSHARISQILLSCDAITTCAGDIGVYKTAKDGGAVVDVDFFASAQSLASALNNSDVSHEADGADAAAGFGRSDVEKPLWEALGLAADPMIEYDIAITLTAAAGSDGTASLKAQYAI